MGQVTITICDVCADRSKDTTHWILSGPTGKKDIDLCDEHAKPLEELFGVDAPEPRKATAKKASAKPRRGNGPRPGKTPVASIEEIRALSAG